MLGKNSFWKPGGHKVALVDFPWTTSFDNSLAKAYNLSDMNDLTPEKMRHAHARFWSKVVRQRGTGCWVWDGQHKDSGYGRFVFDAKKNPMAAHRASWILNRGPIPPGLFVCHTCDNPPCVRPDHLFLGTNLDNVRDMMAKGRSGYQRYPERYKSATVRKVRRERFRKLTDTQVAEIRASPESFTVLARRFSMSDVSIRNIRRGRRYAHLPPAVRHPVLKRGVKPGTHLPRYTPEECALRRSPKCKHPVTCVCKR